MTTTLTPSRAGAGTGLGLPLAALGALLVGLAVTAGAAASLVDDPGAVTRWGLPIAEALRDIAAAVTVGLLVLAAWALPAGTWRSPTSPRADVDTRLAGACAVAVRLAALAATGWVVCGAVALVLSYSSIAGVPVTAPGFVDQLTTFATEIDLLRALLISTTLAAVVAVGGAFATRHATVGALALVALLALTPLALTGHAAGTRGHELAVDSLAGHLVGVSVWVGGLAALVLLRSRLGDHLPVVARRFSTLALACFALVAGSGVVNALVRVGDLTGLATAYGALVVVKVGLVVLLGAAGWRHRSRLLGRLDEGVAGAFWRLVAAELVLMGAAVGLGVALSASRPPVPDQPPAAITLAESITGYPLPGPLTSGSFAGTWRLDLLWFTVAVLLAVCYLVGVRRLHVRADGWPLLRTLPWLAGCALLIWVTCGAPGVYGRVLFSAHMLGHMTLTMVIPPLLVMGAPVTLALRTLTARRDGSRGPREWLLAVVHSRVLTGLSHPIAAAGLFAVSLIAFYYSPLFELSLRTHTGHVLMHVHFLLTGYLFASVLIGIDPGPARPAFPLRLLVLFATMAFHAFFGVALTQGSSLLAPDVLTALGRTWGRSPIADQQYGGAIAWGIGELPTLLLGMGVALAWVRSDDRESRRTDRAADRDGGRDLADYNAMLAAMATRDTPPDLPTRDLPTRDEEKAR